MALNESKCVLSPFFPHDKHHPKWNGQFCHCKLKMSFCKLLNSSVASIISYINNINTVRFRNSHASPGCDTAL